MLGSTDDGPALGRVLALVLVSAKEPYRTVGRVFLDRSPVRTKPGSHFHRAEAWLRGPIAVWYSSVCVAYGFPGRLRLSQTRGSGRPTRLPQKRGRSRTLWQDTRIPA